MRDQLRSKLDAQSLTRQDWNTVGKDKVLQATVLDHIIKKYADYQDLHRRQKAPDYTTVRDASQTLDAGFSAPRLLDGTDPTRTGGPCFSVGSPLQV